MKFDIQPDGRQTYTTIDGDMVDQIAYAAYGTHDMTSSLLYRANPDLAFLSELLPAGIEITIPAYTPSPQVSNQTNLWD